MLPENQDDHLARLLSHWHKQDIKQLGVVRRWVDGDNPDLVASYLQLQEMYTDLVRAARMAVPRVRMVRSQKSERIASHLEALTERALPIVALRT